MAKCRRRRGDSPCLCSARRDSCGHTALLYRSDWSYKLDSIGHGAYFFKLLPGCHVEFIQDEDTSIFPDFVKLPKAEASFVSDRGILIHKALLHSFLQYISTTRSFDGDLSTLGMYLQVGLEVFDSISSRLDVLFLQSVPKQRKDQPRLSRRLC